MHSSEGLGRHVFFVLGRGRMISKDKVLFLIPGLDILEKKAVNNGSMSSTGNAWASKWCHK